MSGIVGSKLNIRGSGLVGSLGTDGQHLLSAGAGKTNIFETVSASADFVKLGTENASNSATVSFDGDFTSDYDTYLIECSNVHEAELLCVRYRQSDSDLTGSDYRHIYIYGKIDNDNSKDFDAGDASFATDRIKMTNTATTDMGGWSGWVKLYDPLETTYEKKITWQFTGHNDAGYGDDPAGGQYHAEYGGGLYDANTSALSGITFLMGTGNIISGQFTLYGLTV